MKYRKKPIVIEAEQWWSNKPPIPWANVKQSGKLVDCGFAMTYEVYYIETLEGNMILSEGDWIIKGVEGEIYNCKDSIFKATYEKVED